MRILQVTALCTLSTAIALFAVGCGGSTQEAESPSDAQLEAEAAEQNKAAEEEMLNNSAPIDDGFEGDAGTDSQAPEAGVESAEQ